MNSSKSYTVQEAIKILENFCAYQERCHKEVEQKINSLRMISEAKDHIILHLMEHNYLNEERFAKAFVRGKFNINKWGKLKITNELKFKNISSFNIKTALKEIDSEEYYDTVLNLAHKKLPLIKEVNTFKKHTKLTNYLVSKGYEFDIIFKIINELKRS
jgi:regulatory protein